MSIISVSVDLRSMFGSARDQGARPTCMAFAASDVHSERRGDREPLSCEYAFFHAQRRTNRRPTEGATLGGMLEALRLDGQPHENGWPYIVTPIKQDTWQPPREVGPLYGRSGDNSDPSFEQIIWKLNQNAAVILLLMLSASFYQPTADGIVDAAPGELPQPQRRHAVVAVGHGTVDGQRAILIRNSWGMKWGKSGYAWLTETFLEPRVFAAATLLENVNVSGHSAAV
jgi:Papain family cysteine protease